MVSFSPAALEAFLADGDTTHIEMLNLIRFVPNGGREQYLDYLARAKPILRRFGAEILYSGDGLPSLTEGQGKDWDAVTLVRYPNRSAFKAMVADPEYQVAFQIGVGSIDDIVLQPLKAYENVV